MKNSILVSILCAVASAAPRSPLKEPSSHVARHIPDYPGIQFSVNGQLSITVFSDLHFGERE
jgi:hypothetical protein